MFDLFKDPSWTHFGYLLWDAGSAFLPFIPGSYIAKGGKLFIKASGTIEDFLKGSKILAGSYDALKRLCKGIQDIEVHHLIEKRFRSLFKGSTGKYLSIVLSEDMHQVITNRWRNLHKVNEIFKDFAYGSDYSQITYNLMVQAVNYVYRDMPDVLKVTLDWLQKNWKGG